MSLRIAVVGGGHLGRIHARLLKTIDDVTVVAVTDPSDGARQLVGEQLELPTYADHRQIIDQVDAAVIASPSGLHATIAADFLDAGKHLLVEKPLTIAPLEGERLARTAARNRLVLQVGHVERFNPAWTAAEDVTRDAKYVEATRASSFPGRCLDVGVVMDLMIHDIDLVLSLTTADVVDVQASGMSVVSDHEDLAEARLTFGCGLVANLKASRVSLGASRCMQVFGPHGFAEIDFGGPAVTRIKPAAEVLDRRLDLASLGDPTTARGRLFEAFLPAESPAIEAKNAILEELHDFIISVQTNSSPTVDGFAGARAVSVAGQVLEAIAQRQWNGRADFVHRGPHVTPAASPVRRAA